MNSEREVFKGDLLLKDGCIAQIETQITPSGDELVIEAEGKFVIPGLIQTHTHLCQALFRGQADDMVLLDWLKKKIWPMEAAHSLDSLRSSAQVGLLEMQLSGTTSILDMATVHHTEVVFEEAHRSGMRYWGGKCLMDLKSSSGPLYQDMDTSLKETEELIEEWHQKTGLLAYALAPRFAVSCSERLLKKCLELRDKHEVLLHTHASESLEEIALIKKRTGKNNVDYLAHLGLLGPSTVLVHGVHLTARELKLMVESQTPLVHCPSSNLKLASGIAPLELYAQKGLCLGLGSDGAPCNNSMDPFIEMRLAALLQKPRYGPQALAAAQAFELATLGGARVLGQEERLGSLEKGKAADVVVVDRSHPSVHTVDNPYSALVYSCLGRDVEHVFISGRPIVLNRQHQVFNHSEVLSTARQELRRLLQSVET